MARRAASDWSTATTSVAEVREPSMVMVGTAPVNCSIWRLTWISGTARITPSTCWSARRSRADSIAAVSSEAVVAALTAYPASWAARSTPTVRAVRE